MLCGCLEVAGLFDLQLLNKQQSELITQGCLRRSAFPQSGSLWQLAGGTEARVWPYTFLSASWPLLDEKKVLTCQIKISPCLYVKENTDLTHFKLYCTRERLCVLCCVLSMSFESLPPAWSACCFKGVVMLVKIN